MPISVSLLRKLDEVEPQLRGVLLAILEELERQRVETVTKLEFNELKEIVRDLAKELKELAEAQKKTEISLRELVESHKRLEKEHKITRFEVGGLSNTVGYVLENEAYKFLPALLKKEFGLEVQERLLRDFVRDNKGKQIEVNIIGEASRDGDRFIIIGESKAQLSKNKVTEFFNKKIKRLSGVFQGELFPIFVTHMKSEPDVDAFARERGIKRIYYSYEFS